MKEITSVKPKPFIIFRLWSAFKTVIAKDIERIKGEWREISIKSQKDYKASMAKINKDTEENLERLRKKKEKNPTEGMSTGQVWGTVAVIAVVMLVVSSFTPDTLDSAEATTLCADKLRAEGGDFSMWKTGHIEDDFRFTVHAGGTIENVYGTAVKVTMVCLVNKLDWEKAENKADAVTSSALRMGHI